MTATYTPGGSDRDLVRLLIPDRVIADPMFVDAELDALLALEGDPLRAAACALETIASDQVMTLKAIKLMELTTNGDKVSMELRVRANALRERAATLEAQGDGGFDVIEQVPNQFAYRERVWDEFLRQRY